MIFSSFVLWGKVFRNFRRTKKDRRGRNLRLSLHDYHSLPAMIAQTPAPRKSFQPFSPVLRKSFHERPEIFGQFIVFPPSRQSPGAKFGSSCAEVFHKRPSGMGSVFQKIERWYGVHIDLLCPEIANDQISGSFKDEQLPYVMEALKFQYGFNYEITGNNVTINKSNQLKIK